MRDSLLNTAYNAVVQPALWADVLQQTMTMAGGDRAVLATLNVIDGSGSAIIDDGDLSVLENYFKHYSAINPLQLVADPAKYARNFQLGILRDEDWMPRETLEASEYYNDFLVPTMSAWTVFIRLGLTGRNVTTITMGRRHDRGRFENSQLNRLKELQPDLIRAFRLSQQVGTMIGTNAGLTAALNQSHAAMLLVDASARLIHVNTAGDGLLAQGDVLAVRQGRLTALNSQVAAALAVAIARAAMPDPENRRAGSVALCSGPVSPIVASVIPLALGEAVSLTSGPSVLISLTGRVLALTRSGNMLAELFGLTPAEIRLSLALADGGSLRSIAYRHRISINTARSQLARIFSKTGINRQVDLVEMLTSFT